jgi:oligopeptide/dipeptide ABC transporter ATP-binding protein
MRQRVMIAAALICRPKLLIADEPTTALDVTTQDQILRLFRRMQRELHMSALLITHDMGVVAGNTDAVAVMYAGQLAELGDTRTVFHEHSHRYTEALLASIPSLETPRGERLSSIPGLPPNLGGALAACPFAPRCGYAIPACTTEHPRWTSEGTHGFACHAPRTTDPYQVAFGGKPEGAPS